MYELMVCGEKGGRGEQPNKGTKQSKQISSSFVERDEARLAKQGGIGKGSKHALNYGGWNHVLTQSK
jgi:hypothetical protein